MTMLVAAVQVLATDSVTTVGCAPVATPRRQFPATDLQGFDCASSTFQTLKLAILVVGNDALTTPPDELNLFLRSVAVQGLHATVLPSNTTLGSLALLQFFEQNKRSVDTVFLLLSTPIAIMNAMSEELLPPFQRSGARVLFAGTTKCEHGCDLDWDQRGITGVSRYLSPGACIGYAADMATLFAMIRRDESSDSSFEESFNRLAALYLGLHPSLQNFINQNPSLGETGFLAVDVSSQIFQSFHGWKNDLNDFEFAVNFTNNDPRLYSNITGQYPAVLLAGRNKRLLAQVASYVPLAWTPELGCIHCMEHQFCLGGPDIRWPTVAVILQVDPSAPFLQQVLDSIARWHYPKANLRLYISINVGSPTYERNNRIVSTWITEWSAHYLAIQLNAIKTAFHGVEQGILSASSNADFVFLLSSLVRLTNDLTLEHLVQANRSVIAPLINRVGMMWSNMWIATMGDFDDQCFDYDDDACLLAIAQLKQEFHIKFSKDNTTEYLSLASSFVKTNCPKSLRLCTTNSYANDELSYKPGFHYADILNQKVAGIFTASIIFDALLINTARVPNLLELLRKAASDLVVQARSYSTDSKWKESLDKLQEMEPLILKLSSQLRRNGYTLSSYSLNGTLHPDFGNLIDATGYDSKRIYPDLYLQPKNVALWEHVYIAANYLSYKNLTYNSFAKGDSHCWDIYQTPLVSEQFCREFIATTEHFGVWSGADRYGGQPRVDERIGKAYVEPVPTNDIQFHSEGFDYNDVWNSVLKKYLAPVVNSIWVGYHMKVDKPKNLNFAVKYSADGQPFLRKHHDSSTFSLNLALNKAGVDFIGGGTRFTRQNCTILDNNVGSILLHPGRLTHQHEGLHVTNGTRYIIIGFIDQS